MRCTEYPGAALTLAAERAMVCGKELFAPNDVRAWLQNGLRTADLALVADFRTLGVPPEAMGWKVGDGTMLDRIRIRHYSAYVVARTLRNAGS